jgi:uncharacterized membrane protein YjjP (DUF1212 family)
VTPRDSYRLRELQSFVVQLGAAMNTVGQPVHTVQDRLGRVARAYGAGSARISAFPTYMMVTMGRGEPATLELTTYPEILPRLDQIAALDRLLQAAEQGAVPLADGPRRLDEIAVMGPRFGRVQRIAGYSVLALGICLILHPASRDVLGAAVLGAFVGLLSSSVRRGSPVQVLMPVIAAASVSAVSAFAAKHAFTDPGLRAMVASLAVFLPGAALTTAVLELAAGQMVSGASRLIASVMQLALLAFGILAGIQTVGVSSAHAFSGSEELLGPWAPWVGVLLFAAGVTIAYSAPARSFPGLLVVLYAAWSGQMVGNALFGGYVSAFAGALVMTVVASCVSRLPAAMPEYASFLPGYWLLVPGALGLIGFAELAGDTNAAGTQDLVATVVSLFAVAVGVLFGTLILGWAAATGRAMGGASKLLVRCRPLGNRFTRPRGESR